LKNIRNILYVSLFILILIGSAVYGNKTANSFHDNTNVNELVKQSGVLLSLDDTGQFSSIYFNNNLSSFDQLENESELIVKVKLSRNRINYTQAVRTLVHVTDVFKGNEVKIGDNIIIFEPSNFLGLNYFSLDGYNLMRSDKEYILFLKHLKKPEAYHYTDDQAVTFMPISSYYAKYPMNSLSGEGYLSREDLDKGINYSSIKDWDIFTTDQNKLKKYNELKKIVINRMVK